MQPIRKLLRRIRRNLIADTHERLLRSEIDYWKSWFETRGMGCPEDYRDRLDPRRPIHDWVIPYIDRIAGEPVEILDVGAGPMSRLGKVHPNKRVSITAVDLLADHYNAIIDSHGIEPPIRSRRCDAQKLATHFGDRKFDIVHAENSMDHAKDALAAVRQMFAVTKAGGFTLLAHDENEGLNQDYSGLHQWDFTCEGGHFVIAGPGRGGARHDISDMYAGEADVECWLEDGGVYAVLAKHAPSSA
jgi:SAM-dependent methyltransferase